VVTGLVFDLPHAPWMGEVLRLRALYDPPRLAFPVEITVVGSSGLGWFAPSIAHDRLVRTVRGVAEGFPAFAFRFGSVASFAGTAVYYLAPAEAAPFRAFQAAIAASGLSFEPTPFGYVPHCTIAELQAPTEPDRRQLMAFPVPEETIAVASVSLYSVERATRRCYQRERISLRA
jgi:2'-5' RNA ligase